MRPKVQAPSAASRTVASPVPVIEVSDDAGALGVWRPEGEQNASDAVYFVLAGAKKIVGMPVTSLAEQVKIEIADLRQEGVGVTRDVLAMVIVGPSGWRPRTAKGSWWRASLMRCRSLSIWVFFIVVLSEIVGEG